MKANPQTPSVQAWRTEPARVGHLTLWDTLCTPGVVQQRDNTLLACLAFRGPDLHSAMESALIAQAHRLNALFRRLRGGWALQTDARRREVRDYPDATWPDPVSALVDQERRAFFHQPHTLYTTDHTLTLVYRPPLARMHGWKHLLYRNLPADTGHDDAVARFDEEVGRFQGSLADCCEQVTRLTDTALLTYLHSTISVKAQTVQVPYPAHYLDTYLSDMDLTRERVLPSLLRWPRLGHVWLRCVGVKAYPHTTQPGILDVLADVPLEYRACLRYLPLDTAKAVSEIRKYRKAHYGQRKSVGAAALEHMSGQTTPLLEQIALDWEQEANAAQAEVQHGEVGYGYLTQTVVVWDADFHAATAKAELVEQALTNADFVAKVETVNTMDAWVGTLPGQTYANVRRPLLHSHNLAHLIPATTPWGGPERNAHLEGPPLLRTVGYGHTPFNLDTYDGDVGMAYIAGPIGCHAKGTLILMADGTRTAIEAIVVGDAVMGPDSQPRQVLALHRGQDMLMEIRPVKGEPFVVNGDHILSLRRTPDGKSGLSGTIVNLSVRAWLQQSRTFQTLHKLYRTGVEFPPGPPLPIPPYLLGVLLGDGDLHGTPMVCNPDPEIYDAVVSYAGVCGYRVGEVSTNTSGCPHYRLIHPLGRRRPRALRNPLTVALERLGLRRCTSATKFLPHAYTTASRADRLDLLAGLLDTDGSLAGNGYDYCSQSRALADGVCFVARSLGLAAYLAPCEKYCQTGGGGTYYRVSLSGDTDSLPCRVKRKQAAPRRQKKSVLMTGFSIHPVGMGDYYGFTCDGDHRYLLGDFTVTHNSGKSTLLATMVMQWLKYPGAEVKIFDTGQSLRCATYAVGGAWYDVAAEIARQGARGVRMDDAAFQPWGSVWAPPVERWQCFELEDVLKTPAMLATVMKPLLLTLKERLTGAPTLFVFDEGHLYLLHDAFAEGIDDYIRGLRKKNGAVLFATQSIADSMRSALGPIISDSAMTRILLPNYHALEPETAKIYAGWGLNRRQLAILANLVPKRQYYYQGRLGHRVFDLALGPVGLAFAGASRKPDLALMDTLYAGDGVQFAQAWLRAKGLSPQADYLKTLEDVCAPHDESC